jgi:3-oxoadipate enol-lactonase
MPFVRMRDIEIYYEIHGSGPRVVLISGTGGDLRSNPRRGHGVLESRCEVLMYHQRGLGQSDKPDLTHHSGRHIGRRLASGSISARTIPAGMPESQ